MCLSDPEITRLRVNMASKKFRSSFLVSALIPFYYLITFSQIECGAVALRPPDQFMIDIRIILFRQFVVHQNRHDSMKPKLALVINILRREIKGLVHRCIAAVQLVLSAEILVLRRFAVVLFP